MYLGRKPDSNLSPEQFHQRISSFVSESDKISFLTNRLHNAGSLNKFCECMKQYEKMIAEKLDLIPVKELLFSDFNGQIKSVGEWVGDFVLVASA